MGAHVLLGENTHKAEAYIIKALVAMGLPIFASSFAWCSGPSRIFSSISYDYAGGDIFIICLKIITILYMLFLGLAWIVCGWRENDYFDKWVRVDDIKGSGVLGFVIAGVSVSLSIGFMAAWSADMHIFILLFCVYNFLDFIMLIMRLREIKSLLGKSLLFLKCLFFEAEGSVVIPSDVNDCVSKDGKIIVIYNNARIVVENFHIKNPLLIRVFIQFFVSMLIAIISNVGYIFDGVNPPVGDAVLYSIFLVNVFVSEFQISLWRRKFYDGIGECGKQLLEVAN